MNYKCLRVYLWLQWSMSTKYKQFHYPNTQLKWTARVVKYCLMHDKMTIILCNDCVIENQINIFFRCLLGRSSSSQNKCSFFTIFAVQFAFHHYKYRLKPWNYLKSGMFLGKLILFKDWAPPWALSTALALMRWYLFVIGLNISVTPRYALNSDWNQCFDWKRCVWMWKKEPVPHPLIYISFRDSHSNTHASRIYSYRYFWKVQCIYAIITSADT